MVKGHDSNGWMDKLRHKYPFPPLRASLLVRWFVCRFVCLFLLGHNFGRLCHFSLCVKDSETWGDYEKYKNLRGVQVM